MINYFKELLAVLKQIESHLSKISKCVKEDHHRHGDSISISTKHWND
jgi:hypothetical protein